MKFVPSLLLFICSVPISIAAQNETLFQPNIRIIEEQQRAYGSISKSEGSPWCDGNKTFWLVGHQKNETPFCYDATFDTWENPEIAMFDLKEEKDPSPAYIDRHDCTTIDVNRDGIMDIICVIGANKGEGEGYTELYLTQPDGSLEKVPDHGLQIYPTVRARYVKTLRNSVDPGNITHVFISAFGSVRSDGAWNVHALYRLLDSPPYFEPVPGSYNKHAFAMQLKVFDWNDDGRDDFILLHKSDWAMLFEQEEGGTFREIEYPHTFRTNRMRAAQIADVSGDEIPDLIVTTKKFKNIDNKWVGPKLKIFRGVDDASRFDFSKFYFSMALPHEGPDLEILDINDDGIPDIYVVQTDQLSGTYCGEYLTYTVPGGNPPDGWVAPADEAQDLLLVGLGGNEEEVTFEIVEMEHQLSGCGYLVEKFGNNQTMILANSDEGHFGDNAILTW